MIQEIINKFGIESQKKKSIEELSELIQAICKEDRENIIEEIADVEIMISQLKIIYDVKEEAIEKVKQYKFERIKNNY